MGPARTWQHAWALCAREAVDGILRSDPHTADTITAVAGRLDTLGPDRHRDAAPLVEELHQLWEHTHVVTRAATAHSAAARRAAQRSVWVDFMARALNETVRDEHALDGVCELGFAACVALSGGGNSIATVLAAEGASAELICEAGTLLDTHP